jgi:hypothetical protein
MSWKKLATSTRILIYVSLILLICGILPLLLIHQDHQDRSSQESSPELLLVIEKLEKEHKQLLKLINALESDAQDLTFPLKVEALPDNHNKIEVKTTPPPPTG